MQRPSLLEAFFNTSKKDFVNLCPYGSNMLQYAIKNTHFYRLSACISIWMNGTSRPQTPEGASQY